MEITYQKFYAWVFLFLQASSQVQFYVVSLSMKKMQLSHSDKPNGVFDDVECFSLQSNHDAINTYILHYLTN
jgi:hypothetical protein